MQFRIDHAVDSVYKIVVPQNAEWRKSSLALEIRENDQVILIRTVAQELPGICNDAPHTRRGVRSLRMTIANVKHPGVGINGVNMAGTVFQCSCHFIPGTGTEHKNI